MLTFSSTLFIPASGLARLFSRESQPSLGRSIALEGIAVTGRVPNALRILALVLLLIAILPD